VASGHVERRLGRGVGEYRLIGDTGQRTQAPRILLEIVCREALHRGRNARLQIAGHVVRLCCFAPAHHAVGALHAHEDVCRMGDGVRGHTHRRDQGDLHRNDVDLGDLHGQNRMSQCDRTQNV
jgi:hypothetical protein